MNSKCWIHKNQSLKDQLVSILYFLCLLYCTLKIKLFIDTAFKQQRLPAWQPILTARNVMPIFFAVAAAFIPIGIGLLYLTNLVNIFCTYII